MERVLEYLASVPLPSPEVVEERPLLALRLHLELRPGVKIEELALEAVQDALDLLVALLQVVGEADQVVERAEEERPLAVGHVELPRAGIRRGAAVHEGRALLQFHQEAVLLARGALPELP